MYILIVIDFIPQAKVIFYNALAAWPILPWPSFSVSSIGAENKLKATSGTISYSYA